jgi:glycosyltransferase involved in cell wall biosynthesis
VIDDQSTDKTAEIVRRVQEKNEVIKLISGKRLPPGWIGKNHALFQGVQKASGEYLLFLDADVILTSRRCISQIVRYAMEHETDLLTLVPELECKTFWEKVVLPILGFFIINRFTLKKINDPSSKITSVVGPFLFFKRQTYEKIGGHERIKGEIVEDLVLAQTIKKKGYRLSYLLGMELFSLREYTNLQEIWEGFSKNFFAGMNQNVWTAIGCIFLMLSVLVLPPLSVLLGLGYLIFSGWDKFAILYLILGIFPYFITIVVRRILKIYAKLDDTYAFLQPLGALVLISILINSIIKVSLRKGVSWKGRVYLDS